MIDIEKTKKEIVERLRPLHPEKIILFGSYAWGAPTEDSDIDLYVVTDDDFLPQNFRQKNTLYLKISNLLTDIEKKMPIDLIVHTRLMYKKFQELDSIFAREIDQQGEILYEKKSQKSGLKPHKTIWKQSGKLLTIHI